MARWLLASVPFALLVVWIAGRTFEQPGATAIEPVKGASVGAAAGRSTVPLAGAGAGAGPGAAEAEEQPMRQVSTGPAQEQLKVTVVDSAGRPAAGLHVSLRDAATDRLVAAKHRLDERGQASLPRPEAPLSVVVTGTRLAFHPDSPQVEGEEQALVIWKNVEAGQEELRIELRSEPWTVACRLVDGEGRPFASQRVMVTFQRMGQLKAGIARTGDKGGLEFDAWLPGSSLTEVSALAFALVGDLSSPYPIGRTPVDLYRQATRGRAELGDVVLIAPALISAADVVDFAEFEPLTSHLGGLRGELLLEERDGSDHVELALFGPGAPADGRWVESGATSFRVDALEPGTWRLEVHVNGALLANVAELEVAAGETLVDPRLSPLDLRGKLDAKELTLRPAPGYRLRPYWIDVQGPGGRRVRVASGGEEREVTRVLRLREGSEVFVGARGQREARCKAADLPTTLTLEPGIPIDVRFVGLPELIVPLDWSARLARPGIADHLTAELDAAGQGRLVVPALGEFVVELSYARNGQWLHMLLSAEVGRVQVAGAGQSFEIRVPADYLDQAR